MKNQITLKKTLNKQTKLCNGNKIKKISKSGKNKCQQHVAFPSGHPSKY